MRRLPMLLLLGLFLSVSLTPPAIAQDSTPESTPEAPPLRVIATQPLSGEELDLNESVAFYFDQPIDCANASITVEPTIAGETTCEGDSLTFTPSANYERATSYTFTLNTRTSQGAALTETLVLSSIGNLAVSQVLPADGSGDVATDAAITVLFNRPVVPLTTASGSDLPSPITITPEVAGSGEWINTSIYQFRPETAFAGGTTYTVNVSAGLTAADESVLPADYTASFTTQTPAVVETLPLDLTSGVLLDDSVQVNFNQPMDQASTEAAFRLVDEAGSTVAGSFEWNEESTGLRFVPDALLGLNTVYTTSISDQALGAAGGQGLAPIQWSFATVPEPGVINTYPADGARGIDFYGSFDIYFASPMDEDTLEDRVRIEPEPWREPDFYYWGTQLQISFPPEPSTDYTITLEPGMADVYGNTIDQPIVIRFSTAAYNPEVMLQSTANIGFYSAYRDETQLFLTHVNVSQIDLALYEVPLEQFIPLVTNPTTSYDIAFRVNPTSDRLLRQWTLDVPNNENVRRYELLTLGTWNAAAEIDCPGAPATRVNVGDVAVITSEDAVRARAVPPDGAIVDLLYRDYAMPIIGGPQCINGILWWEVQLRSENRAWVAEAVDGEYLFDVQIESQATPIPLNVGDGSGRLSPGVYYLSASSPQVGTSETWQIQRHVMVVGTANLVLKNAPESVTVWATDVQTGLPIADAPISVYNSGGEEIASGTTDADGLFQAPAPRLTNAEQLRTAVLQTEQHFGVTNSYWSSGIDAWMFGYTPVYVPPRYNVYVYTDRPLYRPDQPVYFRGVVRLNGDASYSPPDLESVPVRIYNDQGELLFNQQVALTPYGTFSGQFELAADASLGYYRMAVELSPDANAYYTPEGGSVTFSVAEYRLPEFQVTVTPEQDQVVQGDTIRVAVEARYFFGGAVSNAEVTYNVIAQPYFFNWTGDEFYSFLDADPDGGPAELYGLNSEPIASGTVTTDAQGRALIEIPADLGDNPNQSQQFLIEAVVSDESQQAVAGRSQVVVHQGDVYIGVQPEGYVGIVGEEQTINLITVDWESNPIPNQALQIQVVERRWSSVQEQDTLGRTVWTYEVEEIPVTEGEVTTDADGRAVFRFTPPSGGIFKVIATTTDADGRTVRSAGTLWVGSEEYVSWRQQNSNRIDLVTDRRDYEIGDTAEILITSPFQGSAEALITVERGGVLFVEQVTMESNSLVYRLPITAEYAPNVYISVMIVKGVDGNNPVAAFRMGMIGVTVNREQKEITLEISSDTEQAGPGDTVSYTIRATDYAGNPLQAEIGVALTDLASLSIADPNTIPLMDYFYGEQGIGVQTATPLTINVDQLTQTTLDTIKGGDGGFGEGGIFDVREDFVDTAYWNASVVTDANGTATFSVTLPDNLTTWRMDARAVTRGDGGITLVGQTTYDILSTRPLLIRPVTPRFFVVGDQVTLAAIVNNNTSEDLTVDVSLQASGVTISGSETQTVAVPANGRARVEFPVTVQDAENVELVFAARAGDLTDASRPPLGQGDNRLLPVYRFEVPETVGTGDVLRTAGAQTEAVTLPPTLDVSSGELLINLEPSIAVTTLNGLRYLETYPHQCVEQIVSRFLPNIITYRAFAQLNLSNDALRLRLDQQVNYGLQELYAQQQVDGGWGWFVQDRSNPLVTAWALLGLIEARSVGYSMDQRVIDNAVGFLRTQLITTDNSQPNWRLDRQAFILYVLARADAADVARTSTLFEQRERLSYYARAFLLMTFQSFGDTARVQTLSAELVSAAALSANGMFWDETTNDFYNWNTDTRTTAIVLQALIGVDPSLDLLPNVVRWLVMARTADYWETTQETAWAVMALTDWMSATSELTPNYAYSAALNGDTLQEGQATNPLEAQTLRVQVADLLVDQVNRLVIERGEGSGALYYTAYLNVDLPVPQVEALSRGITLERRYELLDDPSNAPITEAPVGTLVQVRLTIIAPQDLYYLVIEDPLPAGTDAIDPLLNTSQQIGTQPTVEDVSDPLSVGWGWWYFSNTEFRDEAVALYATYLPAGTYEYVYTIRTGLPGVYNVIPATGYQFYLPEVYGRSAGSTFTITAGE